MISVVEESTLGMSASTKTTTPPPPTFSPHRTYPLIGARDDALAARALAAHYRRLSQALPPPPEHDTSTKDAVTIEGILLEGWDPLPSAEERQRPWTVFPFAKQDGDDVWAAVVRKLLQAFAAGTEGDLLGTIAVYMGSMGRIQGMHVGLFVRCRGVIGARDAQGRVASVLVAAVDLPSLPLLPPVPPADAPMPAPHAVRMAVIAGPLPMRQAGPLLRSVLGHFSSRGVGLVVVLGPTAPQPRPTEAVSSHAALAGSTGLYTDATFLVLTELEEVAAHAVLVPSLEDVNLLPLLPQPPLPFEVVERHQRLTNPAMIEWAGLRLALTSHPSVDDFRGSLVEVGYPRGGANARAFSALVRSRLMAPLTSLPPPSWDPRGIDAIDLEGRYGPPSIVIMPTYGAHVEIARAGEGDGAGGGAPIAGICLPRPRWPAEVAEARVYEVTLLPDAIRRDGASLDNVRVVTLRAFEAAA